MTEFRRNWQGQGSGGTSRSAVPSSNSSSPAPFAGNSNTFQLKQSPRYSASGSDAMFRPPIFQQRQAQFRTPRPCSSASSSWVGASAQVRTPMTVPGGQRFRTPATLSSSSSFAKTPGTGSTLVEPLDPNTIMSIAEGRGQARGEIGIAVMNLQTPNLILCQFTDTQTYLKVISKVNIFRPFEILMSSTSCDPSSPDHLCSQLQKEVSNIRLVPIQRRIFNEANGLQQLTSLAAHDYDPIVHSITNKYYCLAACAALIKYVELAQSLVFAAKSLRIEFQGSDKTCMVDHITAHHLELLVNTCNPLSSHSVFGILNHCRTPLGARILRMNLLQPPSDEKAINKRLNSVQELLTQREMMYKLQDILSRIPLDIEHVTATLVQIPKVDHIRVTEKRLNYIIALKQTLDLLPGVAGILEGSDDESFQAIKNDFTSPLFEAMLEKIKRVVQDEAQFQKGSVNMKRQRCFAVKADINPILDVARKAYCDVMEDINDYVVELSRHNNVTFRLGTSNQRGFYLQFIVTKNQDISRLPSTFMQVRKRGNVVTFTTEVLISSDHRAQEIMKEIENLSAIVIAELISEIRSDISNLFKVSEGIGYLDLVYTLANYSLTTPRCIRPTFTKEVTSITMGRHPILDSISTDPAVPNNLFLCNNANFMLITGPNMSGKTTFIKQVAILQIMSQIGSFVPAEAASFRIAKNILSRIGTADSITENSSSFKIELKEMVYILQNAGDHSLVIIDELGRATSVEEGTAVSWAMAEELLQTDSFVLFATHYMFLTKLESMYSNVMNYTMETREWRESKDEPNKITDSRLEYSHEIKRGVTDVENYGLKFVASSSYPIRVVEKALPILKAITDERGINAKPNELTEVQKNRNKYLLGIHLCTLADQVDAAIKAGTEADNAQLGEYLKGLQAEFRAMCGMPPITENTSASEEQGEQQN